MFRSPSHLKMIVCLNNKILPGKENALYIDYDNIKYYNNNNYYKVPTSFIQIITPLTSRVT